MTKMRTHTCGELRVEDVGKRVSLCGWVDTIRNHGGVIFIDLRDRYGVVQAVFDPDETSRIAWQEAQEAKDEYVIWVEGTVHPRPVDMINPKLSTGHIEVSCDNILIFNKSLTSPFPLDDERASRVSEDLRLSYRYLDLRRKSLQQNLYKRHLITKTVRDYLSNKDFLEIETPILTKSTPEGARDYIIPSRTVPGSFFALPQSPQQYKQILMVSGFDRYFQIARCFRDEDLRADRQPEFTQIDLEMSFITREDIYDLIDGLLAKIMEVAGYGRLAIPLPRMTYHDAMNRFGSDKPDLRFGMELVDVSNIFKETKFKVFGNIIARNGVIKAINAKGLANVSLKLMETWEFFAKEEGLGGLAHIRILEDGTWKSPLVKFFSTEEIDRLMKTFDVRPGDLLIFAADNLQIVNSILGRLRLMAAQEARIIPKDVFAFTWLTDFPLFELNKEGRLQSLHHPFTAPNPEDLHLLDTDPLRVRALAYDVILNGVELGGGSIRIHDTILQHKIFELLKIPHEDIIARFGHLLKALTYGAPPHGGLAFGLDRIIMLMVGAESLREVIAFPKTQKAVDLMMNAPDKVDEQQLKDVYLQLVLPKEDN